MSTTNFAAAQERVLERRRLREAEARARLAEQQRTSPLNHPTLQRLPYPLNKLPQSGFSLWNTIRGREGIRPAYRVGQVDAELLDEELLGLLKGQVGDALKYFGVSLVGSLDIPLRMKLISNSGSLKCVKTGLMRSSSLSVRSYSSSQYGTTIPLMARHYRT